MSQNVEAEINLLKLSGTALFDRLEIELTISISPAIRNVLTLNGTDSVAVIEKIDESYIQRIEEFMKNDFTADMRSDETEPMKDFLGIYTNCQTRFKFSAGQRIIIKMIVNFCIKVFPNNPNPVVTSGARTDAADNTSKEFLESRKTNLADLSRYMYNWIRNQNTFDHVCIDM